MHLEISPRWSVVEYMSRCQGRSAQAEGEEGFHSLEQCKGRSQGKMACSYHWPNHLRIHTICPGHHGASAAGVSSAEAPGGSRPPGRLAVSLVGIQHQCPQSQPLNLDPPAHVTDPHSEQAI